MITGTVNTRLEAKVQLTLLDANRQPHPVNVVIDTGFSAYLTLPPAVIATLGLTWLCSQQGQLADGSRRYFDVYAVTLIWDGQPRTVRVSAADPDPLLGMMLLRDHELRVEVRDGGAVTIQALP
jgi:clan AA aspartic protease